MSTLYKSVAFNLTSTSLVTVYTCPIETETIIKAIIAHNYGPGNITFEGSIVKNGTTYPLMHKVLSSSDSLNTISGVIVLEEGDMLQLQASTINTVSGLVSFVEVRSDTKNPI